MKSSSRNLCTRTCEFAGELSHTVKLDRLPREAVEPPFLEVFQKTMQTWHSGTCFSGHGGAELVVEGFCDLRGLLRDIYMMSLPSPK